jgi:3-oxoacyl-[acyl-carrier protein] reductase
MTIRGKTALVTGASRGIGRAIALEFARQGAKKLLIVARSRQPLMEVAQEITQLGSEAVPLVLDLAQPVEVNIAIAKAWRDHGPIDLLVNCAGVAYQSPFLQTSLSKVQEELSVNLLGLYSMTRLVARRMAAQQGGVIVNVSSLMGKLAAPTMATYSATKFAILGFTQALRGELAEHNVKVVALLPSLTDTDMVRQLDWFRWIQSLTSEQVAQVLVSGLNRGSTEIVVGWQSHLAIWCNRLAPCLMEKILLLAAPLPRNQRKHYFPWQKPSNGPAISTFNA